MAMDPRLRSPKEKPLFVVGVILSAVVWIAIAVSVVGVVYALFGAVFVLVAHALFLAHVRTNGVRIDERQLPDLHARVRAASARLGLARTPEVYVIHGGGILNAFATKLLSRRYVILLSDLEAQCQDPRQLDFVVGHELGHFAAGHLAWNFFLLPYRLVPWLGAAYSRACEYTCDRCGFAAAGDLEQSMRGLAVLAAGGRIAARVDLAAFMSQRTSTGEFWPTVLELTSSHPFLCKRVAALQELQAPGTVAPVRRSALGWVLAPVLGILGGGAGAAPLVAIAVVGMLAAIAIPNFIKYQLRAKDQGARAGLASLYQAELQHHGRTGEFAELRLPGEAPGAAKTSWTAEEVAAAREIGWAIAGEGYHAYTVSAGTTAEGVWAFAACAEADADGDGVHSAWMVWHPVRNANGVLVAPEAPCRFEPQLDRSPIFDEDEDAPGLPVRASPEHVY